MLMIKITLCVGIKRNTISPYIKDIVQRQKASENSLIVRLIRIGWTYQSIIDHKKINLKSKKSISDLFTLIDIEQIKQKFESGKSQNNLMCRD